jgi:transposase-like protein
MVPELVKCLDRSMIFIRDLVADLTDEEMVLQPPGAPNHGAWTLCHIIFSCQEIAGELGVEPWLPADWESQFGHGSSPSPIASTRSAKSGVLAALEDARQRLRAALLGIDEGTLARPLSDENARAIFPSMADALLQVVAAHMAFHAGQLAVWRRAIGRQPVGVFI